MVKEEIKVTAEKGTLLSASVILLAKGITLIDKGEYGIGLAIFLVGLLTLYLREKLKFGHWHKGNSYWKGKAIGK